MARQLFDRIGNLIIPTLKQWEDGFLRDANPRSELFVWECVAQSYERFLVLHPDRDKAAAASDLVLASLGAFPKENRKETGELQALYRETRNRMNADRQKFDAEVFGALARWPYRQLLLWDDLYRQVSPSKETIK